MKFAAGGAALLFVAAVTCGGPRERDEVVQPPPETADWTVLRITQGTVGRIGDLSIGVVSVRASDGSRAASATLSFFGQAAPSETREIALGERTEVVGRPVIVTAVRTGGSVAIAPGSSSDAATIRVGPAVAAGPCAPSPSGGAPTPHGTIDPRPLVCPPAVVLSVGATQRFIAGQQEGGRIVSTPRVTWSVSPSSLGTISADGVFAATTAGAGTVTATLLSGPSPWRRRQQGTTRRGLLPEECGVTGSFVRARSRHTMARGREGPLTGVGAGRMLRIEVGPPRGPRLADRRDARPVIGTAFIHRAADGLNSGQPR